MNIERVREFIRGCPAIGQIDMINVDFAEGGPINYNIQYNGQDFVSKNIIDKRTLRDKYAFYMRLSTQEDQQRVANIEAAKAFKEWMSEQSRLKNYPEPDDGEQVVDVEAVDAVLFAYEPGTNNGLYQVQFYITYEEV